MSYEWVANHGGFNTHLRPTNATTGYALCGALLPLAAQIGRAEDASYKPPRNTGRICSECACSFALRALAISAGA